MRIESNQIIRYKTQRGKKYGGNTRCVVEFEVSFFSSKNPVFYVFCSQKSKNCPSLVMSCPKFDIDHPKANCKGNGGDFLALAFPRKKRFETIFIKALPKF